MKRLAFPIAVALLAGAVLVAVPFSAALARDAGSDEPRNPNLRARDTGATKSKQAVENAFPNATRKEPEGSVDRKTAKKLDRALKLMDAEKYDEAAAIYNEVAADAAVGKTAQATAWHSLAYIANQRDDDMEKTLDYSKRALDLDALPNATQFGLLLQYANQSMGEEKYDAAIAAIDQWLAQSGSEMDAAYAIKASSLYNLERMDEAAEAVKKAITLSDKPNENWYQLLVASYFEQDKYPETIAAGEMALKAVPNSKTILRLVGTAYVQSEQPDKAVALLSAAYQNGILGTEAEIKQIYQIYNFGDRPLEAVKIIESALAAGKLPRNVDHLRALGDAYRLAEKSLEAAKAYGDAAEFSADGEMKFLQAYMLYDADKTSEARAAALEALKKTPFKSEGQAWILLGNCELAVGNKPGAVAAYTKATGFEATRKSAESWLKSAAKM